MAGTSRRKFVGVSAVGVLGVLAGCGDEAKEKAGDGEESTGGDGDGDGDGDGNGDGDGDCSATPADIEGPFYREGIPVRNDLDLYGDAGVALVLSGKVVDSECAPIKNAVVEFWHASPIAPGAQAGDPDATYDASEDLRYYGQTATDAEGRYQLRTLVPGWYLNGAEYRPAHIHVKVWIGGEERLTTQLYFAGDPFNEADPWFNPDTMLDPDGEGDASFDFAV